ncbi:thiamine-triphosphatase-like [Scyliorhinus torazame]
MTPGQRLGNAPWGVCLRVLAMIPGQRLGNPPWGLHLRVLAMIPGPRLGNPPGQRCNGLNGLLSSRGPLGANPSFACVLVCAPSTSNLKLSSLQVPRGRGPGMSIEVERKFGLREDTEGRLGALGARLLAQCRLEDRYFDTEDYRLTLADFWLRRRDGLWQLKSPAGAQPGLTTQYRETEGEPAILSLLAPLLAPGAGGLPERVEQLLDAPHQLREFAAIVTERTSYWLESGLRVDLDRAGFGHQLGEIEALVGSEDEIPDALSRIQDLARKLDLQDGERQPGKVYTFLQRFRPDHFQRLSEAAIL